MSFTNNAKGRAYTPGAFLADGEQCTRETRQMQQSKATTLDDGSKVIPMGTIYPSNDTNAIGIVYEDVDVTSGDMPGSVVTRGIVYLNRLPVSAASAAKTALTGKGFKLIDAEPTVTRPY